MAGEFGLMRVDEAVGAGAGLEVCSMDQSTLCDMLEKDLGGEDNGALFWGGELKGNINKTRV